MSLDDVEIAARHILTRLASAQAVQFVSSRGASALASEAGHVLVTIEHHPKRSALFAEWLIDQVEVADLFIDDEALEVVLAEDWDGRRADHGPAITARNHGLERQLVEEPDDIHRYLVYADWLQSRGDLHGELIVRQAAAAAADATAATRREAAMWLDAHAGELLGPIAEYLGKVIHVDWHLGFMRGVAIRRQIGDPEVYQTDVLLEWLLDHRASLLMRELELEPLESGGSNQTQMMIAMLATEPPEKLERLVLRSDEVAFVADMFDVLQGLVSLSLQTQRVSLRPMALPRLRELEFDLSSPAQSVQAMLGSKLPALERLALIGHVDADHPGVIRVLDGVAFPELRHLRAHGHAGLLARLAASKLLGRLETLDLGHGQLDDRVVSEILLGQRARFDHLRRLILDDNALSDACVGRVLDAFSTTAVSVELQRAAEYDDDDEYEYDDDDDDDEYYEDDME